MVAKPPAQPEYVVLEGCSIVQKGSSGDECPISPGTLSSAFPPGWVIALQSGSRAERSRGKKTRAAKYGPSLRRIKRDGGLLAALGAVHSHFNALLDSGDLGRGYRRKAVILSLFAGLTTLWFVLQTFVVKENLLANSPNKWLTAIDARDRSILKVRDVLSIDLLHHAV